MFHRAGLANISHTVSIMNLGEKPRNYWGLDYVVVNYTVPREGAEVSPTTTGTPVEVVKTSATSSLKSTLTTGSISTSTSTSTSTVLDVAASGGGGVSEIPSSSTATTPPGNTDGAVLGGSNLGASRSDNRYVSLLEVHKVR